MSLKGLSFMHIAKEKFTSDLERILKKVEQQKFREFINLHKDIFLWKEETYMGKMNMENVNSFPNRQAILQDLSEFRAFAFYKKDKGYYGLDVFWHPEFGIIPVNFNNSRVTIPALEVLMDMANYCEAMLLVNGKKQITKEFIEKEKAEIEEKKKK